jgi:hypothetical protein
MLLSQFFDLINSYLLPWKKEAHTSGNFCNFHKVSNHPIGENSTNLVTLLTINIAILGDVGTYYHTIFCKYFCAHNFVIA